MKTTWIPAIALCALCVLAAPAPADAMELKEFKRAFAATQNSWERRALVEQLDPTDKKSRKILYYVLTSPQFDWYMRLGAIDVFMKCDDEKVIKELEKVKPSKKKDALKAEAIAVAFGKSGNMMFTENAENSTEVQTCDNAIEQAKVLDSAIGGEIAGFTLLDNAHYVGDLSFKGRDGKDVTLADWSGKTVLLNLWATWCVPCRREMPALEALEKAKGGDGFQVVPVSIDLGEPEKPLAFFNEINLKALPFYADGTMKMFNDLKKKSLAFGLPTSLLVNKESCVVGALFGPAEWASDDAFKLIDAAMAM